MIWGSSIFQLLAQQSAAYSKRQLEELKAKAEKGDAKAQCELGMSYNMEVFMGYNSSTTNYVESVKWYRMAAEQGDAEGEYWLAGCYKDGKGLPKDCSEAEKWYLKAAEQGHAHAQTSLGYMYRAGECVPRSYAESTKWFRRAAARGDAVAQFQLGMYYQNGWGVDTNLVEAYKWFLLAKESFQAKKEAQNCIIDIDEELSASQRSEGQRLANEFKLRRGQPEIISKSPVTTETTESPKATGTAFFITNDGYLISNYHVVKVAAKVRLVTGAGLIDATVVAVDAANDLALLKAAGTFAPLPVATSRGVKLGATVATVGFPATGLQGFSPKLAKGEIGSLAGAADDPRYFQISLPVQPGNSGGALVDARGNVVGIVAAKLNAAAALAATGSLPENVNYAVKSSLLLSFLESVPEVSAKLKEPNTKDESFEEVVKSAQAAAVLVLVY